jgi:hypothetical protein
MTPKLRKTRSYKMRTNKVVERGGAEQGRARMGPSNVRRSRAMVAEPAS